MFSFFIENGLISQNQSGFKPGDSCINQLLSVNHEIYKSFDDGSVKYSYFSKRSLDGNVSCFSTQIILSLICLNLAVKNSNLISYCHFYKGTKRFFLNLRGSLAGNVVGIVKKECGFLVHSL